MSKRSFAIITTLFIITVLIIGCSKDNHETLVPLGDEYYIRPIDDIYPKTYRDRWPNLAPGYYSMSGGNLQPPINEGFLPPKIEGEYVIKGMRIAGDETMHTPNGEDIPFPYSTVNGMNIYFNVKGQKNGLANIYIREYNKHGIEVKEVDSVFIYGNGATGEFSMCFDAIRPMGQLGEQTLGYIITGKMGYKSENDSTYGIRDVRMWHVVKEKTETLPQYINIGGQRAYKDSIGFAEKVEYGWGFEK